MPTLLSGARLHGFAQTAIIGVLKLHSLRGCVRHSTRPTASLRPFTRHGRVTGLTAQRWWGASRSRAALPGSGAAADLYPCLLRVFPPQPCVFFWQPPP